MRLLWIDILFIFSLQELNLHLFDQMWQPIVFLSIALETLDTSALIILICILVMDAADVQLFDSVLIMFKVANLVDKRTLRWEVTVSPDVAQGYLG